MRELRLRVAQADREAAVETLLGLVPAGLEEREVDAEPECVDLVLYGDDATLPDAAGVEHALAGRVVALEARDLPDDWEERWKAFHRPVRVGPIGVRPPWEPVDPEAAIDVVVDPAQAFGTGAHPTTRLCLELLLAHGEPWRSGPLADWGAGSGVLAIAGAKLGHAPVLAVDHDPLCVEACTVNAAANDVVLEVGRVDLTQAPGPHAPVVCANLLRPLLLAVAERLPRVPELLIVSGLLVAEGDEIAAAFARHGLVERDRRDEGEWTALALVRGAIVEG